MSSTHQHARALAWAAEQAGAEIHRSRELTGGKTSTMLALTDRTGRESVLRLMTVEPWRTHGAGLATREHAALEDLVGTDIPAPRGLALDADGERTGHPAHLMSRLPGRPLVPGSRDQLRQMAVLLAQIHEVTPAAPFRTYQSWAPPAKRTVPEWTRSPRTWSRAFDLLSEPPPEYTATFLHRDFSHRNLLWHRDRERICGVVDWVETSTGPAWLDASHAATNLALAAGPRTAGEFLEAYSATTGRAAERYWMVLDAVAFLPLPGSAPLFGTAEELARLDAWLERLMSAGAGSTAVGVAPLP